MNPFEHYYDPGDMSMCVGTETTAGEINARGHGDGLLFPLYLDPDMPIAPMETYFDVIRASLKSNGFDELEVYGEPGRALCAEGGAT